MKNKELELLLIRNIEIKNELYDLVEQCLKRIYGENGAMAVMEFEEMYDAYDWNGCLQTLEYIDRQVQENLESARKYKESKQ